MVVNRHTDLVLFAELVDHVEGIFRRLRDDGFDAHLAGKFEDLSALLFIVRQTHHAVTSQCDAGLPELLHHLLLGLGRHVVIGLDISFFLAESLARINLDISHAERLGLVHRLVKRKAIETVRLHAQLPVLLAGCTGFRQAANTQGKRQHTQSYSDLLVHFFSPIS